MSWVTAIIIFINKLLCADMYVLWGIELYWRDNPTVPGKPQQLRPN